MKTRNRKLGSGGGVVRYLDFLDVSVDHGEEVRELRILDHVRDVHPATQRDNMLRALEAKPICALGD